MAYMSHLWWQVAFPTTDCFKNDNFPLSFLTTTIKCSDEQHSSGPVRIYVDHLSIAMGRTGPVHLQLIFNGTEFEYSDDNQIQDI